MRLGEGGGMGFACSVTLHGCAGWRVEGQEDSSPLYARVGKRRVTLRCKHVTLGFRLGSSGMTLVQVQGQPCAVLYPGRRLELKAPGLLAAGWMPDTECPTSSASVVVGELEDSPFRILVRFDHARLLG